MKGWSFIGTSTKAHYFDIPEGKTGGKSLCGKWMLLQANPRNLFDIHHDHELNCMSCIKKLKKKHPELYQSSAPNARIDENG